jgi:aconitate hydratase
MTTKNSFGSRATLAVDGEQYVVYRLAALDQPSGGHASRLPFSLKILLENLLRNEDDAFVKHDDILALAKWDVRGHAEKEIAFRTARVLLQDFTGVPAVVDLAAMREAIARLGGDPRLINPLQPVDLVIDHSVQVDEYGTRRFPDQHRTRVRRNKDATSSCVGDRTRQELASPPGTDHHVNLGTRQDGLRWNRRRTGSSPTRSSAPTHFDGGRLGVLGWGVGGSRRRPRCSANLFRCSFPRSSASSCTASCRPERRRRISC